MKPNAAIPPSRTNPGETLLNVSASSSGGTARSRTNSNAIVTTTGTPMRTQRLDSTIPATRNQRLDFTIPSPSGGGQGGGRDQAHPGDGRRGLHRGAHRSSAGGGGRHRAGRRRRSSRVRRGAPRNGRGPGRRSQQPP